MSLPRVRPDEWIIVAMSKRYLETVATLGFGIGESDPMLGGERTRVVEPPSVPVEGPSEILQQNAGGVGPWT